VRIWLTEDDCECCCTIHVTEPIWDIDKYDEWESKLQIAEVCKQGLKMAGFKPLPVDDECIEFNLSGKKPRHVETWLPPDEEEE
jgi:hypothetical protein